MSVPAAVPDYIHDSVRKLPVLPTAVTRLLALTREVDVNFREIAHVIESDQTLMARTLRAANSPLYAVSRRVQTVQQATVLLGTDAIVNLALGISMMSFQSGLHKQLPIDAEEYGRHSVAVALAARRLATRFKLGNTGEAFVAGLLHDIGKLVLLMHFGEEYARLMLASQRAVAPLHRLEQETFGLDHALVGHALCLHWNLPASLAEAVAEHHTEAAPRSLADVVTRANELVKAMALGNSGNRYIARAVDTTQPRDEMGHDWIRELALTLPPETHQAEDAMGQEGPNSAAPAVMTARAVVQLQISGSKEQELVLAALWSMGYEPVDPYDALAGGDGYAVPQALITDLPLSDTHRLAYAQHGVPVFNYSAWESAQHVDGFLDVTDLREQIEAHIRDEVNSA